MNKYSAKYIQMKKTASKKISHSEALQIIDEAKNKVKKHDALKQCFKKYDLDIDEVDNIPVCFADIDVSARTDKGIIYLNYELLKNKDQIAHYLSHEFTHFAQQTTGDGPTQGSTDDNYLDNPYEQEGFQVQTEYISETKGDQAAKKYISNVLDYHDVENRKERKEKIKELLRLSK